MKSYHARWSVVFAAAFILGCNQGDERLEEKARIEGKAQAEAELQAQLAAQDQLIEKARLEGKAQAEAQLKYQLDNLDLVTAKAKAEGKAQSEAELKVQIDNIDLLVQKAKAEGKAQTEAELRAQLDNIDLLVQKARAEGKVQAEEEIKGQNANTVEKAQKMEADLTSRHLFYRAIQGTYEGTLPTDRGKFNIRVTFVSSLPPYIGPRSRQLEEIISDINSLYLNVQVNLWNPTNPLSSVGCRVGSVRPDFNRGTVSIASENCPNVYLLSVGDSEMAKATREATGKVPSSSDLARQVAEAIQNGKVSEVPEIQGELRPTTNAAIYPVSLRRTAR